MKEYKQPETRIKVVTQSVKVSYYPEYKQVIIPYVWWTWYSTCNLLTEDEWKNNLKAAQKSIDDFLERNKTSWTKEQIEKQRKKEKIKVEYIKYP